MNKKILALMGLGLLLSGCASTGDRLHNPVCTLAGAGGTAAGAAVAASAATGGAAVAGAILGTLLCAEAEPEPMMEKELDSDGDGVFDSSDKCPGTPAGVSVDAHGCALDSDGDGVADHLDQCPNTAANTEVDEKGCPVPGEVLLNLVGVNFKLGSAKLTGGSQDILDEAVAVLRENASVSVSVEGHTDYLGSTASNQTLSERRAKAVMDYLISKGISSNRLSAKGYGETRPVAHNDTDRGRWENRRVELVVD